MLSKTSSSQPDTYNSLIDRGVTSKEDPVKKRKRKSTATLISLLNPSKWFEDFKDIKITMEEFAGTKK